MVIMLEIASMLTSISFESWLDLGLMLSIVSLLLTFLIYARTRFQEILRLSNSYVMEVNIFVRSKNIARDRLASFIRVVDECTEPSAFLATLSRMTFCFDEFSQRLSSIGLASTSYLNATRNLGAISRVMFLDAPVTLRRTDQLIVKVTQFIKNSEHIWPLLMYRKVLATEIDKYYALTYNADVPDFQSIARQQGKICIIFKSFESEFDLLQNETLISVERGIPYFQSD